MPGVGIVVLVVSALALGVVLWGTLAVDNIAMDALDTDVVLMIRVRGMRSRCGCRRLYLARLRFVFVVFHVPVASAIPTQSHQERVLNAFGILCCQHGPCPPAVSSSRPLSRFPAVLLHKPPPLFLAVVLFLLVAAFFPPA